jgi:hypothetical protein
MTDGAGLIGAARQARRWTRRDWLMLHAPPCRLIGGDDQTDSKQTGDGDRAHTEMNFVGGYPKNSEYYPNTNESSSHVLQHS